MEGESFFSANWIKFVCHFIVCTNYLVHNIIIYITYTLLFNKESEFDIARQNIGLLPKFYILATPIVDRADWVNHISLNNFLGGTAD